jgi:fumarylacetoacetate (FAA) hydrolase
MKLATIHNGTRDGRLVLVNSALTRCAPVTAIAPTLIAALDEWSEVEPRLRQVAVVLERGEHPDAMAFEAADCAAPLPRTHHWADGSAYVNHISLFYKVGNKELPPTYWTTPLLYQGGSDDFQGARAAIRFPSEDHGIDFEAEVAVVTDDVPMGTSAAQASAHIKLVMLANDWSLRNLMPAEIATGFGFYQSKPATGFSPVAVTPDELGDAWNGGKLHLPLVSHVNAQRFGRPNAGEDMVFSFHDLIAHAARTRNLGPGAIVGSGTVSNKDRSMGSSCVAERRALEQLESGVPVTSFLRFGDVVRIEMLDADGRSIFGAIEQKVIPSGS